MLTCVAGLARADLVLVDGGMPRATIVVADEPTQQATKAAQAISTYIEQISGARLPIVGEKEVSDGTRILVGLSEAVRSLGVDVPSGSTHQMNEEGFVIKTVGEALVIAGNEDWSYRGTLYAAYDFLGQLGCRWYFPGPFGEVVPMSSRIAVPSQDRLERPSFRFRAIWHAGVPSGDAQQHKWIAQWGIRNRLSNVPISFPADGTITRLAPPEKYFESHPHIYAIDRNGERSKHMLCVSEPETLEIAVRTIKEAFRARPDTLTFGFAPADGHPRCYCEPCRHGVLGFDGKGYGDPSISDLWFRFANQVAVEVRKEFPDRWVLTNGYANRVRPPESIADLSPNLGIQSAMIASCTLHRIGDPKCWQRTLYKQVLSRWTDALGCVFIYDYDPGIALSNLPLPGLHNLRHDIPWFKGRGLWGFWTEGSNRWMVSHLNSYARAKLMWDVETDIDAMVRDYCERFYGAAADAVEEYIWTLEGAVETTHLHETWGRLLRYEEIIAPVAETLNRLIAEAEARASRPETKQRVHVLRLVHDHMNAYVAMEQSVRRGAFAEGVSSANRMITIRDEVKEVQPGLLPHTSDFRKKFRTSIEWHRTLYQDLADRAGGSRGELVQLLPRRWEFKFDPKDIGTLYRWYLPGVGDDWDTIDSTLYWEAQGHQDEQGWGRWGKAWYRVSFHVPADMKDKPLWLTIGAVYNRGVWLWVNGVLQRFEMQRHHRLGHHDVRRPFDVDVTDIIRPGEMNTVAVLVNTPTPGRNPRGGLHRRSFLWTPRTP